MNNDSLKSGTTGTGITSQNVSAPKAGKQSGMAYCTVYIRGSRFWSFNVLQFAIDGKNNSKTKVKKVFFFIF
jgi:hypothetical protein